MSRIVSLKGTPVIQRKVDPDVVNHLEQLLSRAKDGEIVGFAGVAVYCDQAVGSCRGGWVSLRQLGEMTMLMNRIARQLEDAK